MFPRLRNFYYYYMLPKLVLPSTPFLKTGYRWTNFKESPQFFDNSLIKDISYYKPLTDNKGYVVASFQHVASPIKEIIIDDFATLNEREYLAGFVIDVAFLYFKRTQDRKRSLYTLCKRNFQLSK